MIPTDYEWFESYEDTIDRYFADDADWIDGDEDEFGEVPIS